MPAENKKRQPKQKFRLSSSTYIFICSQLYHLQKNLSTEIVEIFHIYSWLKEQYFSTVLRIFANLYMPQDGSVLSDKGADGKINGKVCP